jgi:hypothetical protein
MRQKKLLNLSNDRDKVDYKFFSPKKSIIKIRTLGVLKNNRSEIELKQQQQKTSRCMKRKFLHATKDLTQEMTNICIWINLQTISIA